MRELRGLYIEDDIRNITVQQARFELFEGIQIKGLKNLPDNVEDLFDRGRREY